LYVWDSVAGTSTKDELKGNVGESHGARPAMMLKRGMRRIAPKLAGTKIAIVLLNHQYQPVGFTGYGPKPLMVYGGKGIAYLATLRLRMFRLAQIKDGQGVVRGAQIGIKTEKIKTNDQWGRVATVGIMHGIGIDNVWTIYEAMKERGFITVGGGWSAMQLEGEELLRWQGQWLGLGELCRERPELFDKLAKVYQAMIDPTAGATEE
jgi:RecA/RadA recombinase